MKKPIKTEETTPKDKQPKKKYTHDISNGEERFLQARYEDRCELIDYMQAMLDANFE